jgi:hypothetical protein
MGTNSSYDLPLQSLRVDINRFSPRSAIVLDTMLERTTSRITYLAAFILVCVQAQRDHYYGSQPRTLTASDLKDFAFFEVAKDEPTALELFDFLLQVYQKEVNAQEART